MDNKLSLPSDSLQEIMEHSNKDYPMGVYYLQPDTMFMGYVPLHWHEEVEIDVIREGRVSYQFGTKNITLEAGQSIFISPNILHSIRNVGYENSTILSIVFHPNLIFKSVDSQTAQSYLTPIVNDSSFDYIMFDPSNMWDRSVISYLEDIITYNFSKEFGYELATVGALCQIWLLLLKNVKKPSGSDSYLPKERDLSADEIRIKDALIFIQNYYPDSISLDDIADSIHVSKSECCRLFKRAMKMTPFEYLMHYRILQAADQILRNQKGKLSVSDLASQVGFNNTSYFNKLFKEYLGCTPTEYRRLSKTEHRDKLSHFGLSLSHI